MHVLITRNSDLQAKSFVTRFIPVTVHNRFLR